MELTIGLHRMLWLKDQSGEHLGRKCGKGERAMDLASKQSQDHASNMSL